MYFGTEEDIKLNATNNLNNINDQRLFAQQAKKDLKFIKKELSKLKKPAELVDFNNWADDFQIPEDDEGECRVQATREDFAYTPKTDGEEAEIHTHDF